MKTKRGMTLIETIIAIFIFSLGMAGFTMLFSKSWKIKANIIEASNSIKISSNAITSIVDSLRKIKQADDGSYAIESAGEFDLTVFLDDDNDGITERVHFYLDDNQNLKKGITKPSSGAYPSGDQETQIIAPYITNTSSDPVFSYYNGQYPLDTENNPLVNPQIGNIRLVKIHVWVNVKPNIAPDNVNVESFVELRNINEAY